MTKWILQKIKLQPLIWKLCLNIVIGMGCCIPVSASATTVVELTDAEQVAYSDYILHGTVISITPELLETGLSVTRVTLKVHEWYKNTDTNTEWPETMDFYVRGGTRGDFVQRVSGEFKPQLHDELIVMLEKLPRYQMRPMLVGLSYGAFVIDNTPVTRIDGKRALLQRSERKDLVIHRRTHLPPEKTQIQSAADLETLKKQILHHVELEKISQQEKQNPMEFNKP